MYTTIRNEFCLLPKSKIKAGEGIDNGNYPFFTSSDIKVSSLDSYEYDDEIVVIGTGGKPSCNYVNGKFSFSTDNYALKAKGKIEPKFLYYFLRKDGLATLQNGFHGAGLQHISKDYILNIEIPAFEKSKQQTIVRVLDDIHGMILACQKQLTLLDELIKSRFIEMFGYVDKNTKRFITKQMDEVCKVTSSHRVFTTEFVKEGIPFYRGKEIGELSAGIKPETPFYISKEHYKELSSDDTKPKIGDILIPSICNKGQVWMVNTEEPFYYKDGRVLSISPNSDLFNCKYFETYFKLKSLEEYPKLGSGSTFAEFKIFILKEMDIIVPPIELQNEFAAFVEQVDKSKFVVQERIKLYQELLDKKMDEYFN